MVLENVLKYLRDADIRLTATQTRMIQTAVEDGKFVGIGYEIGRSKPLPLVTLGRKSLLNVIDERGYRCLASTTRAYSYPAAPKS